MKLFIFRWIILFASVILLIVFHPLLWASDWYSIVNFLFGVNAGWLIRDWQIRIMLVKAKDNSFNSTEYDKYGLPKVQRVPITPKVKPPLTEGSKKGLTKTYSPTKGGRPLGDPPGGRPQPPPIRVIREGEIPPKPKG